MSERVAEKIEKTCGTWWKSAKTKICRKNLKQLQTAGFMKILTKESASM